MEKTECILRDHSLSQMSGILSRAKESRDRLKPDSRMYEFSTLINIETGEVILVDRILSCKLVSDDVIKMLVVSHRGSKSRHLINVDTLSEITNDVVYEITKRKD